MKGIREMGGRMISETKDVTTAVNADARLERLAKGQWIVRVGEMEKGDGNTLGQQRFQGHCRAEQNRKTLPTRPWRVCEHHALR